MDESTGLERVILTDDRIWDPEDPIHNERERVAIKRRDLGHIPAGDNSLHVAGVLPKTIHINSINIGQGTYMGRLISEVKTNSFHHPHWAYQQSSSESSRVLSQVSGTLDGATFLQRMIGAINILSVDRKKTRFAGTDPERLSRTLCIGLPTAKQTLEATTQYGLRTSNYPHGMNGRRLRSMGMRMTQRRRLDVRFYVDTMHSDVKGIGGSKHAQVYTTSYQFTKVITHLNELQETIGSCFKEFLIKIGFPREMVTDGHKSYVGKKAEFKKICVSNMIEQLQTEPHSHWQNLSEGSIRELKRLFLRVMKSTGMPRKLWDHLLQWCSDVRNIIALNIPELHGRTPTEKLFGYTPNITPYLDFQPWDPCFYLREFSGEGRSFPSEDTKEIGRWLGVSDNDAEVVTYKILTDKGKVIHRADAMPLTEEEKKEGSPEMKLLVEYNKKIDSYVNEATVSFREDVKFADEGTADVHPSDTTRTFLNIYH